MRRKILTTFGLLISLTTYGKADIKTQLVDYKSGGVNLQGYLAYDDAFQEKRPGVLVVHEWWGLNQYAKKRAEQLAGLGYVAFALDMYGKGVLAKKALDAGRLSSIYKNDRKMMRARASSGLAFLKQHDRTDPQKMAVMGYCFGGTVSLELARSGAPLLGVISFHGGLDTPNPADATNIKGKVLVFHGGDDAYVSIGELLAFQNEMRKAGVDWQVTTYGGAVHGFTNPETGKDNSKGVAYNERADKRSWEEMKLFLQEIFR